ncbi:uncharacterized protein LOC130702711 [Daphnia carinata]|uniref:uncharacterized protein LOC130702711 n=1 Tax=Daphnia carinata TaxID=120202 RepID=UPI00257CDD97|nr:uncharacterized protein LOC130702711 [Daphnia carinata]
MELANYLKTCCLMSHGLTPRESWCLAFKFDIANGLTVPTNWIEKEKASEDWFAYFLKRNPSLSIRAPEATSQVRASAFNALVVDKFFDNLIEVMTKYRIRPGRIWNTDETGIPTVLSPPNVVATKELKQVQQTVSAERGVTTTIVGFICDAGTHCPPVYVFPRKNFLSSMSSHGSPGCLGIAHPSGWINADTFLMALQHFKKFVDCSVDNPILLLLDNHSSHMDYKVICFAKESGIHMLTFPPHCSHRLQPLDIAVFGPFKSALRNRFQDWLNLNPGKRISIHDVAELTRDPYLLSFTPENIISGFKNSGISPFNRGIFPASLYTPSFATDRPIESLSTDPSEPLFPPAAPETDLSVPHSPEEALPNDLIVFQVLSTPARTGSNGVSSPIVLPCEWKAEDTGPDEDTYDHTGEKCEDRRGYQQKNTQASRSSIG